MATDSGPSPRAWGKLTLKGVFSMTRRTIPTGVGKTFQQILLMSTSTDHPHGRGENVPPSARHLFTSGPSPRAWGKLVQPVLVSVVVRTIPTGVGKTRNRKAIRRQIADHPHGRGENVSFSSYDLKKIGPSPRAWGKRSFYDLYASPMRTIPTGVGKTRQSSEPCLQAADHPHGRGENSNGLR